MAGQSASQPAHQSKYTNDRLRLCCPREYNTLPGHSAGIISLISEIYCPGDLSGKIFQPERPVPPSRPPSLLGSPADICLDLRAASTFLN